MAKKHLKEALKKLKYYYAQAESLYIDFALKTEDRIIAEDSIEHLTNGKIALDNILTLYSTGIREAMYDRLDTLISNEQRALSSFNQPLLQALDNLSEDPENEPTKRLIEHYNRAIQNIKERISTLENIKFFKDLPNRATKARKVLNKKGFTLEELLDMFICKPIEALLEAQKQRYKDFLETPIEPSDKGDLDE